MDFLTRFFTQILKEKKTRKRWRVLASTMAGVVVFVTTYSLILPALTIDIRTADEMAGMDVIINDAEFTEDYYDDDLLSDDNSDLIIF